jgi:hypothetical protein
LIGTGSNAVPVIVNEAPGTDELRELVDIAELRHVGRTERLDIIRVFDDLPVSRE